MNSTPQGDHGMGTELPSKGLDSCFLPHFSAFPDVLRAREFASTSKVTEDNKAEPNHGCDEYIFTGG